SNTVPNPREDLKAFTTQSGVTLAGPSVSAPLPSKEVDQEPETITDQVLTESTNNVPPLVVQPSPASTSFSNISASKMPEVTKDTVQPNTKNIQPLVAQTQIPIYEPVVAPKPKLTIPYPLRVNKQKLRKKDDNLALKFVKIFKNLHFELSFADALLHMLKFALMFKSLLNNKEKLFDLATTPVNEKCSAVILKKLPEKLGDPDKFLIPCDFLEFMTGPALIDVYGEELTIRVDDEAITIKVGQTLKYSYNDAESINRIDVIYVAFSDPIIALSSPSLTPFEGGDIILEEIEACLTSEVIQPGIDDTELDLEGDIRLLEELLNYDASLSPLPPKELNVEEIKTIKSFIDEPCQNRRDLSRDIPLVSVEVLSRHGPSDVMYNPSLATQGLSSDSCFNSHGDYMHFYRLSHSELVGIEKVTVCSSLRSQKPKCTIKSRAKRSSINLIRTLNHYELVSHTL
nr:hypothetical protein [Tanacetum cinerariifolium]